MSDSIRFENYELLRHPDGSPLELGRGAMGVTYKARDTDLHCDVALKVINPHILGSPEVRDRFLREARAAARLRHPNIATVFRLGVTPDGAHYYAMEFCDGLNLQQALAAWGPLPTANAMHLAWQVSKALRVAEQQRLIHRDLKPANLIVTEPPDEGLVVKVIDFGLAKSFADGHETLAGTGLGFAGTAHYASPEQIDERDLDIRSDIYSLGVCLWFMLTGQPPFAGSAARVMSQTLSSELPWAKLAGQPAPVVALLRHMLAKNRDDRPATAAALRVEMERCMQALEAQAGAVDPPAAVALRGETERGLPAIAAPPAGETPTIKPPSSATESQRFTARFQLGERLGRDPLGQVFRATDRENGGIEVTYRVIEPALTTVPAIRRELDVQLAAARTHPHPGIVNVLASAVTGQGHIVVSEKIEGFTLLELLKHRGALPPHEALLLLTPLAAAADHAAAHGLRGFTLGKGQTWVHFPADPTAENRQNALAEPVGTWAPHILKVEALSLGGSGGDDAAGQSIATLATAGPVLGSAQRTPATALAQLTSELLGGSATIFTPIPRLTEAANTILRHATTDPAAYPTATAFLTALQPTLGKAPTPASTTPRTASSTPVPAPATARAPTRSLTMAVALAVILACLGLGYYYGIHDPRERNRQDRSTAAAKNERDMAGKPTSAADAEATERKLAEVEKLRMGEEASKKARQTADELREAAEAVDAKDFSIARQKYQAALALDAANAEAKAGLASLKQAEDAEQARLTMERQTADEERKRQEEEARKKADLASRLAKASKEQPWENSLGMRFVPVPGTKVLFSVWDTRVRDFRAYAEATDYRQRDGILLFKVVKNKNGSFSPSWQWDKDASWKEPGFSQSAEHPVVGVSWDDAKAYCTWLTNKERNEGRIGVDQEYRLPTDAEWTAAVGDGKYPWGSEWPPPDGAGNFFDDSATAKLPGKGWHQVPGNDGYARTSPVGSFKANRFGLYDMGGNVWQWCEDWYWKQVNEKVVSLKDDGGGRKYRVLRGGSWRDLAPERLRSSDRIDDSPGGPVDDSGFRCVLAGFGGATNVEQSNLNQRSIEPDLPRATPTPRSVPQTTPAPQLPMEAPSAKNRRFTGTWKGTIRMKVVDPIVNSQGMVVSIQQLVDGGLDGRPIEVIIRISDTNEVRLEPPKDGPFAARASGNTISWTWRRQIKGMESRSQRYLWSLTIDKDGRTGQVSAEAGSATERSLPHLRGVGPFRKTE
jgi:serine/threonine protein kinase/formylglycine-generating enzyme required for sulfatase activity